MKLIFNLFKRISRYSLCILMVIILFPEAMSSSNDAGYVIMSQADIDSALHSLQLLKPIGPSPKIYYRFDLTTKKLSKSNYREYMLKSRIASPDGQWVWQGNNSLVNAKGEKKTLTLPGEVID